MVTDAQSGCFFNSVSVLNSNLSFFQGTTTIVLERKKYCRSNFRNLHKTSSSYQNHGTTIFNAFIEFHILPTEIDRNRKIKLISDIV